ncbi:hypothetical protein [Endozoicomonas sp. OPT23]|uniref:hypothetical protein n=1 Tax=Endozoicomonas sp. OPT23 TaxID=2072845 RepID=UPI00129AAAFB|nr:hypothetical protein [Endozoicomonas sp. OPT23]
MKALLPVYALTAVVALFQSHAIQAQSLFTKERMPTIPFTAVSPTLGESKLVMVGVDKVQYFNDKDGNRMLFGGQAEVCTRYSVAGSQSDRICLASEKVDLVRSAKYQFSYCTFRSGDECIKDASVSREYPDTYTVDTLTRQSVSDDFNFVRPASSRELSLQECKDCSSMKY